MDMKDKALKLWDFLATTGEASKVKAYHILGFAPDVNECPLCEVAVSEFKELAVSELEKLKELKELDDVEEINCTACPLYNRWHGRNQSDHKTCMDNDTYNADTFVQLWYQARTKISRQVYARDVYNNILEEWETELDD